MLLFKLDNSSVFDERREDMLNVDRIRGKLPIIIGIMITECESYLGPFHPKEHVE